jgi:acetylornithine deacetylase/succinyl-diaminopimelate desuccinylase-like protein
MDERALRDEATELLRELIRIDTSNPPGGETPAAELLKAYLEDSGVECELVARRADRANLVGRIRGSGEGPSLTLLGHTDVVPADASDWRHPPFEGHLDEEGYVWGRGAVDMKNEVATRAVAIAALARSGFRPRGDLVFLAVADEEDGLEEVGLSWLVRERPGIRTDYAINEGAGERLVLADGRVILTINVGEKATLRTLITALGESGPSALPDSGANAVPRLAELIRRLADHRPVRRLLPETEAMLEALAGPVDGDLDAALERTLALHPALDELVTPLFGSTVAPTRLQGSTALNVMPARASVECDCRVLPGTREQDLRAELESALRSDLRYELEFPDGVVGGSTSGTYTPLFDACRRFVERNDPGAILVPTLCIGFTDSHYLRQAFGTVAYGFWPLRHTPYEVAVAGIHAHDERIHADDLGYTARFHVELCRTIGASTTRPLRAGPRKAGSTPSPSP